MTTRDPDGRPIIVIPDDIGRRYSDADDTARLRAVAAVEIHTERPSSEAVLADRIRHATIVLSFRPAFTRFPAAVLRDCAALRFICIAGAGVEDVDVAYATSRGIAVGNVVNNKRAIAEHCLALMFDTARQVAAQDRAIRRGVWKSLQGVELGGKVLGIVGLSSIARDLIPLANALGMQVVSWSRNNDAARAREAGATAAALDDVLASADFLSIHLRLYPELQGFIGRRQFALMKPGAILVNTARSELVDEAAMVAALASGRLRGAGLDVSRDPPLAPDHPLLQLDNVVMTPVSAWNTVDSGDRMLRRSIDNVLSFMAGRPVSVVNAAELSRIEEQRR